MKCSTANARLLGCMMAAFPAMAIADEPVHGTYGHLYVKGSMTESTCRLAMDSARQTIDVGTIASSRFQRPGDRSEARPLTIRLENCVRKAGSMADETRNVRSWSSMQPLVSVTFSGEADISNPALFRVSGAKGIGLRLLETTGHPVYPGRRSAPHYLSPGQDSLHWTVSAERTTGTLLANSWQTTIGFSLDYF